MPPSRPSRLRKLVGLTGVSAVALIGSAVFATSAYAHEPHFTASSNCGGVVSFSASAWEGDAGHPATDAERTHTDMAVKVSDDSGPWHDLPGTYAFTPANGFAFSGTYTPPAGWASIRIETFSRSFAEASSPVLTVTAATGCTTPAQPSATIADASCADHGAVVTLKNEGGTAVDFDVNGTPVTVGPNDTETTTVTFPGDTPSTVTVTAPGMADVVKDVDYHCTPPVLLAASVADASCADSGAIVHLVNNGGTPADFTIEVPGSPDQTVTVPANTTADQAVALPQGTSTITVTSASMADVTKDVTYTCASSTPVPPTPPTPPTDTTPVPPVFLAPEVGAPVTPEVPAVSANSAAPATAEVTPAPASTAPGEVLAEEATAPAAAPSSATLPFTGSESGPLALTAFGSLLAGLAMVFAGRRRTVQQ